MRQRVVPGGHKRRIDGLGHDIGIPVLLGLGGALVFGLLGLALIIFAIVRLVSTSGERRRWARAEPRQMVTGTPFVVGFDLDMTLVTPGRGSWSVCSGCCPRAVSRPARSSCGR